MNGVRVQFTLIREICGIQSQLVFDRLFLFAGAEDEAYLFDAEMAKYPGWTCGCYSYMV